MHKFTLCLALAGCPALLSGGSSINLTPGNISFARIPNALPYNAIRGFRLEGRITHWTAPTIDYNRILGSNGGSIVIFAGGLLACLAGEGSNQVRTSIAGRADVLFRCQRDVANTRLTLEVWGPDGGNYVAAISDAVPNPQPISWAGDLGFGSFSPDPQARLSLAYLRWYSAVLPLDSAAPTNSPGSPDLADWEFERNTHDSSGKIPDFPAFSISPPGYLTTPVYPPAASLTKTPVSVRAGESITLDASRSISFADNAQLTFVWQQLKFVPMLNTSTLEALAPDESSALGTIQWSSQTTSTVTATITLAGTYYFRLTVTDATGQTGTRDFTVGAVTTDSKGIVLVPDPKMSFLLGPLTLLGTSPWPWYDSVMKANADAMFGPGGVPSTPPFKATASGSAGTLAVTNSRINGAWQNVTGIGTHFITDFACNGSDTIVIYYQLQNGKTGVRPYKVVSCSDDTRMIINQNTSAVAGYDASSAQTGLSYNKLDDTQNFGWLSTTTSWNYYDVVLALYRLYYRSGVDTYLINARQLADEWYTYPLDGGRAFNNGNYTPQGARTPAPLGLMARALDGRPEMWLDSSAAGAPIPLSTPISGIKGIIDILDYSFITRFFASATEPFTFFDPRETGYAAWFLAAYQYLNDPGYYPHVRDVFLGTNSIRSRYQAGFGFVTNAESGGLTGYGYSGPTNRGSLWLTAFLLKALVAFTQSSSVPNDQNAALSLLQSSYTDFISAHYMGGSCQEITYSSNFQTCTSGNMPSDPYLALPPGRVSATNGSTTVTGTGTNFLNTAIFRNDGTDYLGIDTGTGFQMLNIPSGAITSATNLRLAAPFGGATGATLAFGRAGACPSGVGRPGYPQNSYSTLDADIAECDSPPHYGMGGRAVSELIHQVNGYLYYRTGSDEFKTRGDAMFAAAYGCGTSTRGCLSSGTGLAQNITGGGPGADAGAGNFADLLAYPIDSQYARGKEFGSNAGAAMADTYLAYRLGGEELPTNRNVQIGFDAAAVPVGGQVRVTVVKPTGNVVRTLCSASPCTVAVDARMGNHLLKLDYLSAAGAVLASGLPAVLKVK